jgi:hypothetical protein
LISQFSSVVDLRPGRKIGCPPYFMSRDMFFHDDTEDTNGSGGLSGALVPFTGQPWLPAGWEKSHKHLFIGKTFLRKRL